MGANNDEDNRNIMEVFDFGKFMLFGEKISWKLFLVIKWTLIQVIKK